MPWSPGSRVSGEDPPSRSIGMQRHQTGCCDGQADGKFSSRFLELQQRQRVALLRDDRVGVRGRPLQYALARVLAQLGDSGRKWAKFDQRFAIRPQ